MEKKNDPLTYVVRFRFYMFYVVLQIIIYFINFKIVIQILHILCCFANYNVYYKFQNCNLLPLVW